MSKDIIVPAAGESISEGELSSWYKKDGDWVEMDEVVGEIETDKAALEIRAPEAGTLHTLVVAGITVTVGQKIATVTSGEPPAAHNHTASPAEKTQKMEPAPASAAENKANFSAQSEKLAAELTPPPLATEVHATPAARKLLNEHSLAPEKVVAQLQLPAATKNEPIRLHEEHVKTALNQLQTTAAAIPPAGHQRTEKRTKISRLRATIAKRLVLSQQTGALLTTFNEVDMHAASTLRKRYKEDFKKKYDVNLGFMSFFVKATVLALQAFPIIHSRMEAEAIVEPQYIDIGIAVATPKGLVVPVLKDVTNLHFHEIEARIKDFALRGKAGKLALDELSGGTFTITNGGVFGSMLSTPIVNYPQSAILGMHNIVERPVARNGEILIHPLMYVALSYDHRLIDGSDAVKFLYRIKELIEDPQRLLINV